MIYLTHENLDLMISVSKCDIRQFTLNGPNLVSFSWIKSLLSYSLFKRTVRCVCCAVQRAILCVSPIACHVAADSAPLHRRRSLLDRWDGSPIQTPPLRHTLHFAKRQLPGEAAAADAPRPPGQLDRQSLRPQRSEGRLPGTLFSDVVSVYGTLAELEVFEEKFNTIGIG